MLKDVTIKVLTTLIAGIIIAVGSVAYNSINEKLETINKIMDDHPNLMNELEELKGVKVEMEAEYKRFKSNSYAKTNKLEERIVGIELHQTEQDKKINYCQDWVTHWVNLQ